jgi:fucose 4-O-acetylase-like acetyltransferase
MTKRIYYFDNLKFILISLVVIGHFLQNYMNIPLYKGLWIYVYSFHMPAFFVIAGYFHRNSNIGEKVIRYVCLGIMSKICLSMIKFIWGGKLTFSLLIEKDLPWFMYVMAIHVLLAYLLRNFNKKFVLSFFVILTLFIGYDRTIGDFLCLYRAIIFFPFYVLGMLITPDFIERIKEYKITGLTILVSWLVLCLMFTNDVVHLGGYFTGRNPFSNKVYPYGSLIRIVATTISAMICMSLFAVTSSSNIKYITKLGEKTLQIYLWHRIFLYCYTGAFIGDTIIKHSYGAVVWPILAVITVFFTSHDIFQYPFCIIDKGIDNKGGTK